MKEWIAENPDKLGKDFYQFSEQALHRYWGASKEDIEAKKLGRIQEVKTGAKFIKMKSPKGKKWNVPIKEKQRFIDNGYTEE